MLHGLVMRMSVTSSEHGELARCVTLAYIIIPVLQRYPIFLTVCMLRNTFAQYANLCSANIIDF